MNKKTIFILHEYGAPTHYLGLKYLANKNGYDVKFYEFELLKLLKGSIKGKYSLKKLFFDIIFLLSLPFIKKSKIIIGIAPFNKLLPLLMIILKRHEVYYHTSYTYWDGNIMVYSTKSKFIHAKWKEFTNSYVKHIFAVSNKTKEELVKYGYSNNENVSVVNHSLRCEVENNKILHNKNKTFIFVGRLTKAKGIIELLDIFSQQNDAKLIIIGDGDLATLVSDYAKKFNNIIYKGYIIGLENIIPYYYQSSFLLMNSKRIGGWEELFGISIIEGMACGCVPITTDHSGPKEIIKDGYNGIICKEGDISKGIEKAIKMDNDDYILMKNKAVLTSKEYSQEKISNKWIKILE